MSTMAGLVVRGCVASLFTLILTPSLARAQLFTLSSIGGWWDYDATYIRQVNPATGATISYKEFSLLPGPYVCCGLYSTGMAANPTTGEFFVLFQRATNTPTCEHLLARIDRATDAATIIGNTGTCFSSLAFHSNGTLYGVSGGTVPPALFTLNTTTAAATFLISFGTALMSSSGLPGGSGLAFNPTDGLLYRTGLDGPDPIFQAINPTTLAVTNVPLSGLPTDEIITLTHSSGNTLLGADVGGRLFSITTGGFRSFIGPLDHLARGMVFTTEPASAVSSDYDGDGKSDIGIYRNGSWSIIRSSDGAVVHAAWGGKSWSPISGDFDGDARADIAVYNPIGVWSIVRSSDGGNDVRGWGGGPTDIPAPEDYDGDGKSDVAIYRDGSWCFIRSSDGRFTNVGWGGPSWIPVAADYDGDGKADIAVYNSGAWSIIRSSDAVVINRNLGGPSWTPVVADYDGDGKADIAVYRSGTWSIIRSSDGVNVVVAWGGPGWLPVPADYDGDRKTDIAVYTLNGVWSILRSSNGGSTMVQWDAPDGLPLSEK